MPSQNEDAVAFVEYMNGLTADATKWFSPRFKKNVGNWQVQQVQMGIGKTWNYRVRYTVPLDWCHSYDQREPLSAENRPIAQGGYVSCLLDNASAGALNAASGLRFQTTLSLTTEYFEHVPHGEVYVSATADKVGGRIGFATATLYADDSYSTALAKAVTTAKLSPAASPAGRSRL